MGFLNPDFHLRLYNTGELTIFENAGTHGVAPGLRAEAFTILWLSHFLILWATSVFATPAVMLYVWNPWRGFCSLQGLVRLMLGVLIVNLYVYQYRVGRPLGRLALLFFSWSPKYYSTSSFRFTHPRLIPELEGIMALFDELTMPTGETSSETAASVSALGLKLRLQVSSSSTAVSSMKAAQRGSVKPEVRVVKELILSADNLLRVVEATKSRMEKRRASLLESAGGELRPGWWGASGATGGDVYVCHPHGIIAHGFNMLALCPVLHGTIWTCISSWLYYTGVSVVGYAAHIGTPMPATASAIDARLSKGQSIAILPGGFEEATLTSTEVERLYIQQRFGVFRKALLYNARLIPYFTFGESLMYNNLQGCWPFRLWLNANSVPGCVMWSERFFLPSPKATLHVVIGKPLLPAAPPAPVSTAQRTAAVRFSVPEDTVAPRGGDSPAEWIRDNRIVASKTASLKNSYMRELKDLYDAYAPLFSPGGNPRTLELW